MEGYATRLVDTLRPLLIPEAVNYVDPLHTVLVQLLEDIVSRCGIEIFTLFLLLSLRLSHRSVEESCPSMSANSNLGSGTEKSSRGASSSQPMRMSFDEDIRHHLRVC